MGFDTSGMISGVIDYIKNVFDDMSPIVLIFLGLNLGILVVESIVLIFSKKKTE
jgi:type II secretory pathway component PulF